MAWSERQRALLREMGVRVWQPAPAGLPPVASPALAAERTVAAAPAASAEAAAPAASAAAAAPAAPAALAAPAAAEPASTSLVTPAGVATLDWPALRAAVAACTACTLCSTRKQTVFGVGHPRAHWMVIGEAPGAQEDEQGEPFVGAAGQLLDAMLRALGLTRDADGEPAARVYIANTLKCRPPGNRNPQADEMMKCEPFLLRQIELVQPKILLAMGRFAVQALLRSSEPIGRLRGRVHRYQGVPLIVTYHPAYLLRNLPDKARAWEDLCLAADTAAAADRPAAPATS